MIEAMVKIEPLTPETLRTLLIVELLEKFPNVELAAIAVKTADGSTQWLVEVRAPVKLLRTFRPDAIGQVARARLLASELARGIEDRLGSTQ